MRAPRCPALDDGVGAVGAEPQRPRGMTHLLLGQPVDHRPLVQPEAPQLGRPRQGSREQLAHEPTAAHARRGMPAGPSGRRGRRRRSGAIGPARQTRPLPGNARPGVPPPERAQAERVVREEEVLDRMGDAGPPTPLVPLGRMVDPDGVLGSQLQPGVTRQHPVHDRRVTTQRQGSRSLCGGLLRRCDRAPYTVSVSHRLRFSGQRVGTHRWVQCGECASRGSRPATTRHTVSSTATPERGDAPAHRRPALHRLEPTGAHPVRSTTCGCSHPVIPRSKVIGIGRNYADHAKEMGTDAPAEPMMFLIPNTAVVGPGDPVVMPPQTSEVGYEGELAVVIGRLPRTSSPRTPLGASSATPSPTTSRRATCSAATGSGPAPRASTPSARSGRGSRPTSTRRTSGSPPGSTARSCRTAPTSDMVHGVATLVSHASKAFTLLPGDVILTGTPAGVGLVEAGQRVEVEDRRHRGAEQPLRASLSQPPAPHHGQHPIERAVMPVSDPGRTARAPHSTPGSPQR